MIACSVSQLVSTKWQHQQWSQFHPSPLDSKFTPLPFNSNLHGKQHILLYRGDQTTVKQVHIFKKNQLTNNTNENGFTLLHCLSESLTSCKGWAEENIKLTCILYYSRHNRIYICRNNNIFGFQMGIHVISACDPLTDWISGCFLRSITADARLEILRMAHCLHVKLFVNYHKKDVYRMCNSYL